MWIFMLMMMVTSITRGRSQEEGPEQPRIHSAVDESSSLVTPQPTRKRNRRLRNTEAATEHHSPGVNQEADATQTTINPPKRRGQNINRSAMKALENLPDGTKISLTMDKDTKAFVGTSGTQFATECGIVIRNVCPLNFHKWESIPKDVKDKMYEKLQVRFNLLRTDRLFMEYVNTRLRNQWKRTRCDLSAHWKSKGGLTNPQNARSQMKSNCRSQEDWNRMCDYWELESTRKYSNQMKIKRGKQVVTSRGGSRSIANHIFQMTNHETQVPSSPLEVYHKLHFNAKKQGWQNDDARIEYENITHYKEEAMAKLISEGTNLTTTMEHEVEREAIKSVCAKEKTIKSAWEVGVGPVLRKKDYWMTSEARSSQPPTSEAEALRNQVASLEEELKQSKDKYDKMSMFMSSKFLDFDRSVSTPTSSRATGSVEQINDSDNEGFGCQ